ncbi:RNA-splicing factor [Linnemannia elongata]|nr:RNA-splicing factor [Linnemannia elongata]
MYQAAPSGGARDEKDQEDYLLGKRSVDDILKQKAAGGMKSLSKDSDNFMKQQVGKANSIKDLQAKVREDPLLAIKRREQASLEQLMKNPIKMRQLKESKEGKDKDKKKKSKRSKEDKADREERRKERSERRHKKRKASRDRSDASENESDDSRDSRDDGGRSSRKHQRRSPSPARKASPERSSRRHDDSRHTAITSSNNSSGHRSRTADGAHGLDLHLVRKPGVVHILDLQFVEKTVGAQSLNRLFVKLPTALLGADQGPDRLLQLVRKPDAAHDLDLQFVKTLAAVHGLGHPFVRKPVATHVLDLLLRLVRRPVVVLCPDRPNGGGYHDRQHNGHHGRAQDRQQQEQTQQDREQQQKSHAEELAKKRAALEEDRARRLKAMTDDANADAQARKNRLAEIAEIEAKQDAEEEAKRMKTFNGEQASFMKSAQKAAYNGSMSLADRVQRGRTNMRND